MLERIKEMFGRDRQGQQQPPFMSRRHQIRSWHRANKKMKWGIPRTHFDHCPPLPQLSAEDKQWGYGGCVLFYGFGDDGKGNSDPVLSGKVIWDYARRILRKRTWHCEYIHFDDPSFIRLHPGAPARPKGFYWGKIQTGKRFINLTVSQARKLFRNETGLGPEGLQFLIITHPNFRTMMNEREHPFMAFADYDVAPYGYYDFFDAVQMFVSNGVLGLGIGNVDRNYPFFGIPTMRIEENQGPPLRL